MPATITFFTLAQASTRTAGEGDSAVPVPFPDLIPSMADGKTGLSRRLD